MYIHKLFDVFFSHFRTKRLKLLYEQLEIGKDTRVLDVGGSLYWWDLARKMGLPVPDVTILNIYQGPDNLPPGIRWIVGNGKSLPFDDKSFDLVFNNSVIEHLSDWESQRIFAAEIMRVGSKHYTQTPNKYFFVEPHLITPFIHWLPQKFQLKLLRNFTLWGLMTRPSQEQCHNFINEVRLLAVAEVGKLFPDSEITREKFCGLTKSIIAIKK
jgi:SAM-dependent methyltransferase